VISKLHEKSLADLTKIMGNAEPGPPAHTAAAAELARRQTRMMLWSLLAVVATSGLGSFFQFLSWYAPRIPQ
jgi:hypothetical protein